MCPCRQGFLFGRKTVIINLTLIYRLIYTNIKKTIFAFVIAVNIAIPAGFTTANDEIEYQKVKACPANIEGFIKNKAEENGVDGEKAVFIAKCESSLRPKVTGDNHLRCKKTGKPMRSRGIWQINECSYPEILDKEAFNLEWSTNWAIEIFKKNQEEKEWVTCTKKYSRGKGV